MKDPIVEEVRRIRMEHTRQFNGDLDAIFADLRAVQGRCGHKVVRLAPNRIQPPRGSTAPGSPS